MFRNLPRLLMHDLFQKTPPLKREELSNNDEDEEGFKFEKKMSKFHFIEARMPPIELSDCIHSFHHWLQRIEEDAYDNKGIGWEEGRVKTLLFMNQVFSLTQHCYISQLL